MSRKKKDIGDWGEDIAASLVKERGMTILERNFRDKRGEIDIIARKDHFIHFIEVKTRSCDSTETIESSLGDAKLKALHRTALAYLAGHKIEGDYEVCFDLITVIDSGTGSFETNYISSFFYPSW